MRKKLQTYQGVIAYKADKTPVKRVFYGRSKAEAKAKYFCNIAEHGQGGKCSALDTGWRGARARWGRVPARGPPILHQNRPPNTAPYGGDSPTAPCSYGGCDASGYPAVLSTGIQSLSQHVREDPHVCQWDFSQRMQ